MDVYGNPSSTHDLGRKARIEVEQVRKLIADQLNCSPGEIFFTSGGTEADNLALFGSVRDLGVKHIITSPIEHKAVLETAKWLADRGEVRLTLLSVNETGNIDLNELEKALQGDDKTLVSLMYANNEIGNINPMKQICALAKANNALVHSDAVQAVCHTKIDLQELELDFLACAAHKFHGPKGAGFCFIRGGLKVAPQIMGGGQERNMRAGTENIVGIVGLGKAFELAYANLEADRKAIKEIKKYTKQRLSESFSDIVFMGNSAEIDNSLFTVLSVGFPNDGGTSLMTFSLDMKGIAVSGGSACNSGSNKGSHVISALGEAYQNRVPLRVSFSKHNTKDDIDKFIEALVEIRQPVGA